jgi:hypothetical protein
VAFLADVFVDGHFVTPRMFRLSIKINLWGVRKSHRPVVKAPETINRGIHGGPVRHSGRADGLAADMYKPSPVS